MAHVKKYNPTKNGKKTLFLKGILLYLLPLPILWTLFFALLNGEFRLIIVNGIAYALFLLGASFARRGFVIEKEYKNSILAKAPKIKYKSIASVIISVATFFTSYFATANGLFLSILLGLVAFVGFYLYYGLDPRVDKVGELNIGVRAEDVIEITSKAKQRIKTIKKLSNEIADSEVETHLGTIINETEGIIKSIEENPNDLSRARKFFNVYLHRTEAITDEYAQNLKNKNIDTKMRKNYIHLLETVKETIIKQKERLNEDDITRLDVQIEALTKQIKNEGV
jgi:5-bromo-4-chloroindolyl phosphate hydrolysis protein